MASSTNSRGLEPGVSSELSSLTTTFNSENSGVVKAPVTEEPGNIQAFKTRKRRAENFSEEELKVLGLCMQEHGEVLNAAHSPNVTNTMKNALWEEISKRVTAVSGIFRDVAQLKARKKTLKSSAKSKAAQMKRERGKTGGGSADEVVLSEAEQIILQTISPAEISGLEGGIDIFTMPGVYVSGSQETLPEDTVLDEYEVGRPCLSLVTAEAGQSDVSGTSIQSVVLEKDLIEQAAGSSKSTPAGQCTPSFTKQSKGRFRSSFKPSNTECLLREQVEITKKQYQTFVEIRKLLQERNDIEREKLDLKKRKIALQESERTNSFLC